MTGPGAEADTAGRPAGPPRWRHALLLVGVCAVVYFVGLSWRSFSSSEGHRVAPGWAFLDPGHDGGWWRVSMFEATYLRKPPGMPWAIAGMSSLLGQNEFAARSVSALATTLSALAAWWFASRWFGRRPGLAAGLALALMPQLWAPGRSAEIEALHNLGVLLAALAAADLALRGREGRMGARVPVILLGAAGVVIAALAKGPAGAPVFAGVIVAGAILRLWTARGLAGLAAMAGLAAAVLTPLALRILRANADPNAITQGADDFLWSRGVGAVLMLAPTALVSALPASLALLLPWGHGARTEAAAAGSEARRALRAARLLAASWLVAMAIMAVAGMSNPRYAMPAAGLLGPLIGYAVLGAWGPSAFFEPGRRRFVRAAMLGRPAVWAVVLAVAALGTTVATGLVRIGVDGREAGARLAALVEDAGPGTGGDRGAIEIWADGLVEARPDVLLYARQRAHEAGRALRPLWKKHKMGAAELPSSGGLLVLRSDAGGDEVGRYQAAIDGRALLEVGEGEVGRYRFRVFRSR